ncbi:MAG: helix-turn-helix domain-containing protein [Candidatus Bathyarchaeia archaeon]
MKNDKKVLIIIPVGVTAEVAKGFLAYASPNSIVTGVYLNDGKFMDAKRSVLDTLKIACDAIGADFHEHGVTLDERGFASLIRMIREVSPDEIYLGTITGPRLLDIFLMKVLYEYTVLHNVSAYLIVGVEGETASFTIKINSMFTSLVDLGPLQKKTLFYLAKRGVASVDEMAEDVGVSKWTFYKTLSSLIESGLVERIRRGSYKLTLVGEILAGVEETLNYGQP